MLSRYGAHCHQVPLWLRFCNSPNQMTDKNQHRTCLITGTSSGIGAAIAHRLTGAGHTVVGLARRPSQATVNSVECDIADTGALESCIDKLKQDYSFDCLVCNAGYGRFGSLEEFSLQQISTLLQTNLVSHISLCRMMLPELKSHSRSDIVFIGSESALAGGRYGSVYSAAKFGLRGFSQALRHECTASNCHVGIINPGMVQSGFFDELNFEPGDTEDNALQSDDVADAVMQLISSADHAVVEEININPLKRVVRKKGD